MSSFATSDEAPYRKRMQALLRLWHRESQTGGPPQSSPMANLVHVDGGPAGSREPVGSAPSIHWQLADRVLKEVRKLSRDSHDLLVCEAANYRVSDHIRTTGRKEHTIRNQLIEAYAFMYAIYRFHT